MTKIHAEQSNKDKILEAASALFLDGGVSALSVRAIAKRAGVSTIGIYSHYNGKDGLLEALYIQGFEMVSKAMIVTDPEDIHASIILGCERYLDIADNYRAHYQLIFGEAGAEYVPSLKARSASVTAFEKLVSFTSPLLPPNSDDETKRRKALEIWALIHGFVCLKHHSVGRLMPNIDWRPTILSAVESLMSENLPK